MTQRYGPATLLFDDYEPAGESCTQPSRYAWVVNGRNGQFRVAFPPAQLRTLLPGLLEVAR
ncbi:hypothetical protein LO763_19535 [Glycomyces sp. A-F 0318]|uniref:hypothetical protein n=1 Tax=Glycomyces amatae TaxID=2881355 RepID=UPI001E3D8FD2|nr:hypothetical protein [Glycomyces amatae]MCD0445804.1 hypothetical protein [Glycomyces amatae]